MLVHIVGIWYNTVAALLQSGNREEVNTLEFVIGFLVSVAASVAGNCVSKRLDRHSKGK